MTREEEIQVSREKYNKREGHDSIFEFSLFDVNSAYIEGAEWADSHPRKGLVDIEKVCTFLHGVRLDYYAEHNDELIEDLRKALEE